MERGASFLAGIVTCGVPRLEQCISQGLHWVGGTHTGTVCEKLQATGRSHLEKFVKAVSCGTVSTQGEGKCVMGLPCKEK